MYSAIQILDKDMYSFNPCFRGTCSWCLYILEADKLFYCFNPCFRGTCSWWTENFDYDFLKLEFQSLFSWNLLLMGRMVLWWPWIDMFQSLFSWNLLLMSADISYRVRGCQGFNPCFRGTCSWCLASSSIHMFGMGFQSLFSWNLLLMIAGVRYIGVVTNSFNPCFRGTCSWCLVSCSSTSISSVSILVFVELALDVYTDDYKFTGILKFQSLFSWNLLLMWRETRRSTKQERVSILVFVELALDGWFLVGRLPLRCVSILVFVELALDVLPIEEYDLSLILFQSLFSWNLLLMFGMGNV